MVQIRELNEADKKYIRSLAYLHKKAFPSFFITQLGIQFIHTLYMGYLEDNESGIIVAEDDEKLIGFIAYSKNYPEFYKGLIKNHLIKFALCTIGAAVKHPSFIKRILGAFSKSESVIKDENYVELASICVDPKIVNHGVGTQLIDYMKNIVDFSKYSYINLETDADNNDGVNKFYIKNDFQLERSFSTAEGRRMNEYRYTLK